MGCDGRTEPAARAKLGDNLAVEALVACGLDDARQQPLGALSAHGVTQFALVVVELIFEQERIGPGPMRDAERWFALPPSIYSFNSVASSNCGISRHEIAEGVNRNFELLNV